MEAATLAYQEGPCCLFTPGANDIWAVLPTNQSVNCARNPIGFVLEDSDETMKYGGAYNDAGSTPTLIIVDRVVGNINPSELYIVVQDTSGKLSIESGELVT